MVASAQIPLEFHVQISGQDFKPEAKGLADTLVYPTGLPIYHDRVAIVYEWRPADGKENRLNPRTQKPYGPIWRPSVAEQMEPENLTRHLNTMEAWLDIYVPRSFSGVVCLDVESWPLKSDDFHMDRAQRDANAREAPGKKAPQLMGEFIRATQARARQLRPNVKAWGWWGMGGMHPAWPLWKPDQYEAWKSTNLEGESRALASIEVPMPSFYFPDSFNSHAERIASWEKVRANWIAMYGRDRLIHDGYAYLNVTHGPGPKAGQALTREQFHECLEQARAIGMRRFVVWDYVDGPQKRDTIQKFLDQVLKPEVEAIVAQDKAKQDRAAAGRSRDSGPPPARESGVPARPAGRD